MTVVIPDLPERAAAASLRLRDEFLAILGDDLIGMWLFGGTTFADRPRRPGDLDIAVVVGVARANERIPQKWRDDPSSRPARLFAVEEKLGRELDVKLDIAYFLASEIGSGALPPEAFRIERPVNGWAVLRAHWLARQYVHLHGRPPDDLVVAPTSSELERDLDRELEHLERHVHEGDAVDPYEATYAVWNGCRILHTLETGNPVISKRSAGTWALQHLPERWYDAIHAAGRAYDGAASEADNELLRVNMAPFIEMVRMRVPVTEERPPGPPRWS